MLKRDFIMVQIEELGKVIAQIIFNRNANAARKNPALIQTVYSSLKLNPDDLMNASPADLIGSLDNGDGGGVQRLEIAIKALIEESYLQPEKQKEMLLRAKELLEYLQTHDNTFSFERVDLLDAIGKRLLP